MGGTWQHAATTVCALVLCKMEVRGDSRYKRVMKVDRYISAWGLSTALGWNGLSEVYGESLDRCEAAQNADSLPQIIRYAYSCMVLWY